jgi:hypothetical protein
LIPEKGKKVSPREGRGKKDSGTFIEEKWGY